MTEITASVFINIGVYQ